MNMTIENATEKLAFDRLQKNFFGHLLCGHWFIFWSFYSAINLMRTYWKCQATRQPFTATLWFSQTPSNSGRRCCLSDYNICFILSCIQAVVVFAWCFEDGRYVINDTEQYLVLFLAQALHCLLASLQYHRLLGSDSKFLPIDYLSFAVSNVSGAVVLYGHMGGSNPLQVSGHAYSARLLLGLSLLGGLEASFRHNLKLPFLRALLTMIVGTWFIHLAFALYPPINGLPYWDFKEHHFRMFFTACFGSHVLVDLGLMFLLCWIATRLCKPSDNLPFAQVEEEHEKLMNGRQH